MQTLLLFLVRAVSEATRFTTQIFVVNKFEDFAGYDVLRPVGISTTWPSNAQKYIIIDAKRSSVATYAHEVGHSLGVTGENEHTDEGGSKDDIMYYSGTSVEQKRVRRIDWNRANP